MEYARCSLLFGLRLFLLLYASRSRQLQSLGEGLCRHLGSCLVELKNVMHYVNRSTRYEVAHCSPTDEANPRNPELTISQLLVGGPNTALLEINEEAYRFPSIFYTL